MANLPIKVGLLIPHKGAAGIWAPSCEASAILAAAEINAGEGMLGRELHLVAGDAGASNRAAAEAAVRLATIEKAEVIVGMTTSSAREAVSAALQPYGVPFVYTPQFEGRASHPGAVTIGESSNALLRPSVNWLQENKRAKRFFLVGNDYKWPLDSMIQALRIIADSGGLVVGSYVVGMEDPNHDAVLERIKQSKPDVVVQWLLGSEAISFNRNFVRAGLASTCLRLGFALEETILLALGEENSENIYACSEYFETIPSRNNDKFLERYYGCFGAVAPPPNTMGQSLYEGLHGLCSLASASGGLISEELKRCIGHTPQARTARGNDLECAAGVARPVHLAVADGTRFKIVESF